MGYAKFDVNRCNESPLRDEKPDFWPVSKFNTGSLPLRGILPVIRINTHRNTYQYIKIIPTVAAYSIKIHRQPLCEAQQADILQLLTG